jgi:hypothetical protein
MGFVGCSDQARPASTGRVFLFDDRSQRSEERCLRPGIIQAHIEQSSQTSAAVVPSGIVPGSRKRLPSVIRDNSSQIRPLAIGTLLTWLLGFVRRAIGAQR